MTTIINSMNNQWNADITVFARNVFGIEFSQDVSEFVCKPMHQSREINLSGGNADQLDFIAVFVWWSLLTHSDMTVTLIGQYEMQLQKLWSERVQQLYDQLPPFIRNRVTCTAVGAYSRSSNVLAEYRVVGLHNRAAARGIHQTNNFVVTLGPIPDQVMEDLRNIMSDPNPKLIKASVLEA